MIFIRLSILVSAISAAVISNHGSLTLCEKSGSPFSIGMNKINFRAAEDVCKNLGKKLAVFNSIEEVQKAAEMMASCSEAVGNQIFLGWINKDQPNILESEDSFNWLCMAVDRRFGIVAGTDQYCLQTPSERMFAICKDLNDSEDFGNNKIRSKPQNKKAEGILPTIIIPLPTIILPTIVIPPLPTIPIQLPIPIPLPLPINLAAETNPTVVAIIDNLRIVTLESLSPAAACAFLALNLGNYNPVNLNKVISWAVANTQMATFVDSNGLLHIVMPNGAVYNQLFKGANQISNNNAVCQIP